MRRRGRTRWLGSLILLSFGAILRSAASEPEDELKSATVLTFIRHAEWRESATGPINVAVWGRSAHGRTLRRTLEGRSANSRPIHIVDAKLPAGVNDCQVVYIAGDDKEVRQTLAGWRNSHALTIGESGRFLEYGGAVNLVIVDGHIPELRGEPGSAGTGRRQHQFHAASLWAGHASRVAGQGEAARMRSYASIRRKLTFLIAGGGIVAALIAAAGFSWLDLNRFQQNTNALVAAIANIVAVQVEPSITLGDRKVAAEILNSLRSDRMIRDAVLDDGAGCLFRHGPVVALRLPRPSSRWLATGT